MVLVAVLFGVGTPYLFGTLEKQRLLSEQQKVVSVLKDEQSQARSAQNASAHGIEVYPTYLLTLPEGKKLPFRHSITVLSTTQSRVMFDVLTGAVLFIAPDEQIMLELQTGRFKAVIKLNQNGVIESLPIERR